MTAGSGLSSPPLKLPKLSPAVLPPSKPSKRTSAPDDGPGKCGFVVVDGVRDKAPAVKLARRSSGPLTRTAGLPGAPRPLLRRRSGDFSLPVRYKVRRKKRQRMLRRNARLGRTTKRHMCSTHTHTSSRQKPLHSSLSIHFGAFRTFCCVAHLLSAPARLGIESRFQRVVLTCSALVMKVQNDTRLHDDLRNLAVWERFHESPCVKTHQVSHIRPLLVASVHPPKYVIIPGNNSRAVLAAFRRRPWWGPARKEEDASAAAVVRSSFVSRRKKGGRNNARDGTGNKVGYRCVCCKNDTVLFMRGTKNM